MELLTGSLMAVTYVFIVVIGVLCGGAFIVGVNSSNWI